MLEDKPNMLLIAQNIEIMMKDLDVDDMTYEDAKDYAVVLEELLNLEPLFNNDDKEVLAQESTKCLLTHVTNPIKITVMIIDILTVIED